MAARLLDGEGKKKKIGLKSGATPASRCSAEWLREAKAHIGAQWKARAGQGGGGGGGGGVFQFSFDSTGGRARPACPRKRRKLELVGGPPGEEWQNGFHLFYGAFETPRFFRRRKYLEHHRPSRAASYGTGRTLPPKTSKRKKNVRTISSFVERPSCAGGETMLHPTAHTVRNGNGKGTGEYSPGRDQVLPFQLWGSGRRRLVVFCVD